jgi:hypothetical protein
MNVMTNTSNTAHLSITRLIHHCVHRSAQVKHHTAFSGLFDTGQNLGLLGLLVLCFSFCLFAHLFVWMVWMCMCTFGYNAHSIM